MVGPLLPALDGHLAVARVDTCDDAVELGARGRDELRLRHQRRAEHRALDAHVVEHAQGVHVPDAAADLDRDVHRLDDRLHRGKVAGLAQHGAVEVHDVDPLRARRLPTLRLVHGVVVVDRHSVEPALAQPHDLAVQDVDRRQDVHVV
jgi:hypothetical protein